MSRGSRNLVLFVLLAVIATLVWLWLRDECTIECFSWEDRTGALPPVGSQGKTSSCASWSTCEAIDFYRRRYIEPGLDLELPASRASRSYLHNLSLQMAEPCNSSMTLGSDGEVTLSGFPSSIEVSGMFGVASEATAPSTSPFSSRPTARAMDEAERNRCMHDRLMRHRWHVVAAPGTDDGIPLTRNIAEVGPSIVMIQLRDDFDCSVASEYVPRRTASAALAGRSRKHVMLAVGYAIERCDGRVKSVRFRFMNSWGPSWADSGFVWIDARHLFGGTVLVSEWYEYSAPTEASTDCPRTQPCECDCNSDIRCFPALWCKSPGKDSDWPGEQFPRCGSGSPKAPDAAPPRHVRIMVRESSAELQSSWVPGVPSLYGASVSCRVDGTALNAANLATRGLRLERTSVPKSYVGGAREVWRLHVDRTVAVVPMTIQVELLTLIDGEAWGTARTDVDIE